MFFARLPIEIRKMVYEFVVGEEVVHLTFGARKRFGHFICEDTFDEGGKECGCRVLVGGRGGEKKVDCGGIGMVGSCWRM
jgi:hypothetical protein